MWDRRFRTISRSVFMAGALILLVGCDALFGPEEEESSALDGLSPEIQNIVTEEQLGVIEGDLGLTIHRGNNPPTFNSEYKAEPSTMRATTVPSDGFSPGDVFNDYWIRFYNQNNENQTISLDTAETNSLGTVTTSGTGTGGFIVGDGDAFSVFAEVDVFRSSSGITSVVLFVWSGVLTSSGITDFEYVLLMSDNNGDPGVIPNNTGRSFFDGDGNSPLATFPLPSLTPSTTSENDPLSSSISR